ncbi:unnamed protein product, partial [Phaeothamnion confervicola]
GFEEATGGFTFAVPFEGSGAGAGGYMGPGGDAVDDDSYIAAFGALSGVRHVEKIDIKYATRAKRVDVRRLKKDIWKRINLAPTAAEAASGCKSHGGDGGTDGGIRQSSASLPPSGELNFSDVVEDLSAMEEQCSVTLPFYFICLLHLANEKGLRLEGREDLTDLSIAADPGAVAAVY